MRLSYFPSFQKSKGTETTHPTLKTPKSSRISQASTRQQSAVARTGQTAIEEVVIRTKPNHKPLHSHWGSHSGKIRPLDDLAPPPSVSWGAFDPISLPKKVSISRATLHPDARDPSSAYHFQDMIQNSFQNPELLTEELQAALESNQFPATKGAHKQTPSRNASFKHRPEVRKRRQSPVPYEYATFRRATDSPTVPPKARHTKSYSAPISKFSPSANALSRTASKTAKMTAAIAAHEQRHKAHRGEEEVAIPIALDRSSFDLVSHDGAHEITPASTASERHQANKRLYHKMKAENHNLWVLLDASNRRANLMMETLHAEEQRCRTLEIRATQLQATLNTLNARRLWQDEQIKFKTPSIYEATIPSPEQAAVNEITAELEQIRHNIAQSRNTVRRLGQTSDKPVPESVKHTYETALVDTQESLHKTIHQILEPHITTKRDSIASMAMMDPLDERMQELIRPKPVRPVAAMPNLDGLSPSNVCTNESSTEPSPQLSEQSSGSSTPDLSVDGSSGRTNSDESFTPPMPLCMTPTPPRKSSRRIQSEAHIRRRLQTLASVHPALRGEAAAGLEGEGTLAEIVVA